ncbi:MAG: aquaporin [Actinomycetota bacterium]
MFGFTFPDPGDLNAIFRLSTPRGTGAPTVFAVTIGLWVSKRFPTKEVLPCVIVQVIGAILAGPVWRFLSPSDSILDDEPAEARAY